MEHQLWQATSDSSALLAQLQAAGVPARRVLLISSEPLDPAALPPGSRYRLLPGTPPAAATGLHAFLLLCTVADSYSLFVSSRMGHLCERLRAQIRSAAPRVRPACLPVMGSMQYAI